MHAHMYVKRLLQTLAPVWKEPRGAKMTQVECVYSTHGNLVPDKSMLWVWFGWLGNKASCESQKFQVSALNELPALPLVHGWSHVDFSFNMALGQAHPRMMQHHTTVCVCVRHGEWGVVYVGSSIWVSETKLYTHSHPHSHPHSHARHTKGLMSTYQKYWILTRSLDCWRSTSESREYRWYPGDNR